MIFTYSSRCNTDNKNSRVTDIYYCTDKLWLEFVCVIKLNAHKLCTY